MTHFRSILSANTQARNAALLEVQKREALEKAEADAAIAQAAAAEAECTSCAVNPCSH
jgi:hypothetical protein